MAAINWQGMTSSACFITRNNLLQTVGPGALVVPLIVALSSSLAYGQSGSVASRLLAATDTTSLESIYKRPWYMKVQVDIPAKNSSPDSVGTIERWQDGERSKTVYSLGSSQLTQLNLENKQFRVQEGDLIPDAVEDGFENILHPGPSAKALEGTQPELRRKPFGNITLDCVMLARTLPKNVVAPLGLFPTYCLSATDQIAASYNFGSRTFLASTTGKFLDHTVVLGDVILNGAFVLVREKVNELKTFTPTQDQFDPTPEMAASENSVGLSGDVVSGRVLSKEPPVYPASARAARISGTVILSAVIGEDGHIEYLTPTSVPDVNLAIAAMDAVRRWRYKPYLLNGRPTKVTTTITVNFNMRP